MLFDDLREKYPTLDFRDTWWDNGICIVKPGSRGVADAYGPMAQSATISKSLPDICAMTGAKTVIWDTITADARRIVTEWAKSGKHRTSKTRDFKVADPNNKGSLLTDFVAADWRDYGATQTHLREAVRDVQLLNPDRNYHLIHVLHQESAKKPLGIDNDGNQIFQLVMHGPNAGGPGSVEAWGTEYQAVNRIFVEGENRFIELNQFTDKAGVPFAARTNTGGKPLPSKTPIPSTADGARKVWAMICTEMGLDTTCPDKTGYYSGAIYGVQGCGKTRWVTAFLLLPETLPAIYVASDGDSEYLRSWWNELKGMK